MQSHCIERSLKAERAVSSLLSKLLIELPQCVCDEKASGIVAAAGYCCSEAQRRNGASAELRIARPDRMGGGRQKNQKV